MKFQNLLSATILATGLTVATAHAESVVRVTLIDKVGTGDLTQAPQMGMGMKADMSMAKMGININPKTAQNGYVRFDVTNLASNLVHEVLLARITDENQILPYDQGRNKVDMEGLQTIGSVSEIDPSKTASMTLDLKPGKYLLYCNYAGHYMAGMWTVIEVK